MKYLILILAMFMTVACNHGSSLTDTDVKAAETSVSPDKDDTDKDDTDKDDTDKDDTDKDDTDKDDTLEVFKYEFDGDIQNLIASITINGKEYEIDHDVNELLRKTGDTDSDHRVVNSIKKSFEAEEMSVARIEFSPEIAPTHKFTLCLGVKSKKDRPELEILYSQKKIKAKYLGESCDSREGPSSGEQKSTSNEEKKNCKKKEKDS